MTRYSEVYKTAHDSGDLLRIKPRHSPSDKDRIHMIYTENVFPSPSQPRKKFDDDSLFRLADSIRRFGILQPITVRQTDDVVTSDTVYEIIAGERRYRAARLLGLERVPCIILKTDSRTSAELAIIENIQREDLNFFDEASAISTLIGVYRLTQEEVAQRLSVSQSYVANKLRILRLSEDERSRILAFGLTERHARALLKIENRKLRLRVIDHIHEHSLNVISTEVYIERLLAGVDNESADNAKKKLVLKDIRIFYNTINKAVSILKQAGVNIISERFDSTDGSSVLTITIPSPSDVSRETSDNNEQAL